MIRTRTLSWLAAVWLMPSSHLALAAHANEVSAWEVEVLCDSAQHDPHCVEYSATLELHRIGDEFCGKINETTEFRSPDGWFVGRASSGAILVRFVDSFQGSETEFASARIDIRGSRLKWTILSQPLGDLHDEARFKRSNKPPAISDDNVTSCSQLQKTASPISIFLPSLRAGEQVVPQEFGSPPVGP